MDATHESELQQLRARVAKLEREVISYEKGEGESYCCYGNKIRHELAWSMMMDALEFGLIDAAGDDSPKPKEFGGVAVIYRLFVERLRSMVTELAAIRREVGADEGCQFVVSRGVGKCLQFEAAHTEGLIAHAFEPESTLTAVKRAMGERLTTLQAEFLAQYFTNKRQWLLDMSSQFAYEWFRDSIKQARGGGK